MSNVAIAQSAKVAFGEVVKLCRERSNTPAADGFERYIGLDHIESDDLRIHRWGNVADGVTFTNVFRPGQVLFGKRRAYQRKVAVADFSGVCSSDIYVLAPRDDRLLPELLPFICQTAAFFEHAVGTSAGSLSPRTNWDSLATFEFALPSVEEQRRLASRLLAVKAAVESYKVLDATAEPVIRTQIAEILRGNPSALPLSLSDAIDVRAWTSMKLGDLCKLGGGHGFRPRDWSDHGMPIIRIQNVRGSADFNYFDGEVDPSWVVEPGELLFAWAGVPGVSFGPGIWRGPRAVLNQHIYRVTPNEGVERDWLHEVLLYLTPLIERRAHGFKSSLLHIRKIEFTSQQILVPPSDQQRILAAWMSGIRRSHQDIKQRSESVERIYKILLSELGGTS